MRTRFTLAVLTCGLLLGALSAAARPFLAWDRSPDEAAAAVTNYCVWTAPPTGTNWTRLANTGLGTNLLVTAVHPLGQRYRATAQAGPFESDPSNTVTNGIPGTPGNLKITITLELNAP